MVANLLDMKSKADSVVADAFGGGEMFAHALKESFESFINCRQNRPAELIAKFIDAKLKAGNKVGCCNLTPTETCVESAWTKRRLKPINDKLKPVLNAPGLSAALNQYTIN